MVLLEQYIKDKRKTCDGRCYKSPGDNCKCICGGANHGKGLQEAIEYIVTNRKMLEGLGMTVLVEDRLMFDTEPRRIGKNVKRVRFCKRFVRFSKVLAI